MTRRRNTPFPKYTHVYRDRHGKIRCDFRRGAVSVPLPYPLLGPGFWDTYREAFADYIAGREPGARSQVGSARTKAGTVAGCFCRLYRFNEFPERASAEHPESSFPHSPPLG